MFSVKCSISCNDRTFIMSEWTSQLFHLKDHQTGVDHKGNQVIQGPKLGLHASGAESFTVCLTTQIDVSMAWELWGAYLGKLRWLLVNVRTCGSFCVTNNTVLQNVKHWSRCWRCSWQCWIILTLFGWTVFIVWGVHRNTQCFRRWLYSCFRFSVLPLPYECLNFKNYKFCQ